MITVYANLTLFLEKSALIWVVIKAQEVHFKYI